VKVQRLTLTCVEGNAEVRSVSCVSSAGRRRGMDSTNAAWQEGHSERALQPG